MIDWPFWESFIKVYGPLGLGWPVALYMIRAYIRIQRDHAQDAKQERDAWLTKLLEAFQGNTKALQQLSSQIDGATKAGAWNNGARRD